MLCYIHNCSTDHKNREEAKRGDAVISLMFLKDSLFCRSLFLCQKRDRAACIPIHTREKSRYRTGSSGG